MHFTSPGRCIYCGATSKKLTDEHIIPLSLGGVEIFDRASCTDCSDITKRYEGVVGRKMFYEFRVKHNLPTRRKKERPAFFEIRNKSGQTIRISPGEHSAPVFMFKFARAMILRGYPEQVKHFPWTVYAISGGEQELVRKYDWNGAITTQFFPIHFARVIAKVGHAYAVSRLGLHAFEPLAIPVILNQSDNVGFVVGGQFSDDMTSSTDDLEAAIQDACHLLTFGFEKVASRQFVVCYIRLFAQLRTPTYHAVVGEIKSADHIRSLIEHGVQTRAIELSSAF